MKLRNTYLALSVLFLATLTACGDNETIVSSSTTHAIYYAAGGVAYVGDSPSNNVTITISDSENTQWTTTSNTDGLWRIDNVLQPDTYKIEYSTPGLPTQDYVFTISADGYYYGNNNYSYNDIENNYIYLGQVTLTEQPLEAIISPFSVIVPNQQVLRDGAGSQTIQYSLSNDNDIVVTFNYPLWSADDVCLLDSDEVPLFTDTNGDGLGDYPLCATFDAANSTFTFARSDLDQAYLGDNLHNFVGTSTMTGLIADNTPSTHYLLWIGVKVEEYSNSFILRDYMGNGMQAFSPQFGTAFFFQSKVYFNVVP